MPENQTEDVTAETTDTDTTENTETIVEEFDPQRAMTTIKTLRTEAKATAKALKEATARLQEIEDAKLSESERLQRQLEDLTADRDRLVRDAQTAVAGNAITEAASKAGAIRPDAIARLIELSAVEFDNGRVINADALVTDVRTSFPELFAQRPGNADAGAGKGAPTGAAFSDVLRRQLSGQ